MIRTSFPVNGKRFIGGQGCCCEQPFLQLFSLMSATGISFVTRGSSSSCPFDAKLLLPEAKAVPNFSDGTEIARCWCADPTMVCYWSMLEEKSTFLCWESD